MHLPKMIFQLFIQSLAPVNCSVVKSHAPVSRLWLRVLVYNGPQPICELWCIHSPDDVVAHNIAGIESEYEELRSIRPRSECIHTEFFREPPDFSPNPKPYKTNPKTPITPNVGPKPKKQVWRKSRFFGEKSCFVW